MFVLPKRVVDDDEGTEVATVVWLGAVVVTDVEVEVDVDVVVDELLGPELHPAASKSSADVVPSATWRLIACSPSFVDS